MKRKKLVSVVIVTRNRKKDLTECINSYLNSSYHPIEIIVVDNASKPPIFTWFSKKYPKVKIITLEKNMGAAEGRNVGLRQAKGEYILFTDDDAYADAHMINYLTTAFEKDPGVGMVQPLIYDKQRKNMLLGAGYDINLTSGRIKAWGVREIDKGQFDGLREIPMVGCVWMVRREVFSKVGEYDKDYFIPYEDSDFSIRVRKAGYKIICTSKAKTYHQGVKTSFVHPWIEWLGITSKERAYRVARNKMIFMRKHSPFPNNLLFFFALQPIYFITHSVIILAARRLDIALGYGMGFLSGVFYCLAYPIRKPVLKVYSDLDRRLLPIKELLVAYTDPLTWVIDTKGKTILDLASGLGRPMQMIKLRMKVEKAVGVDLFEPYIEKTKAKHIHDQYILEDIRKVKFPKKSFDIVIASHVLEHLPKHDAWKVLENMEKWAKKQVIVGTPIGEHYHPIEDGNILQLHVSAFQPEDFIQRGYKIKRYGWNWLLGYKGISHSIKIDLIRKILYTFNILITPIYYLFQDSCDYIFVAYKKMN